MTNMIALEDMQGMSEAEVKSHIADEYAGTESGYSNVTPSAAEKRQLASELEAYDLLLAYESVGSCGCDSSSWFLMRHKINGTLHTISGFHCSCYGFQGQGEIEEVDLIYLKSDRFHLPLGGHDENAEDNERQAMAFIASL